MTRNRSAIVCALLMGSAIFINLGCQKNEGHIKTNTKLIRKIELLANRLEKLELHTGINQKSGSNKDREAPIGPIKSLTLRIETKDDRLRIYWANGTKSDLPCTKEQSIWVCG